MVTKAHQKPSYEPFVKERGNSSSLKNVSWKENIVLDQCNTVSLKYSIDHFHKWRPIINSFASIKINLTDLILKLIIQKKFYSETRLVKLI